jgi:hypothetical protein
MTQGLLGQPHPGGTGSRPPVWGKQGWQALGDRGLEMCVGIFGQQRGLIGSKPFVLPEALLMEPPGV